MKIKYIFTTIQSGGRSIRSPAGAIEGFPVLGEGGKGEHVRDRVDSVGSFRSGVNPWRRRRLSSFQGGGRGPQVYHCLTRSSFFRLVLFFVSPSRLLWKVCRLPRLSGGDGPRGLAHRGMLPLGSFFSSSGAGKCVVFFGVAL